MTLSDQNCFYFYSHEIELKKLHCFLFSVDLRLFSYFRYFYIKLSCIFVFLVNIESMISWIFSVKFFEAVKELHKIRFPSTTTFTDTKLPLTQNSKHWKTDQYWWSDNSGELDLDLDINWPASDKLRQYTTVPIQCEQFP